MTTDQTNCLMMFLDGLTDAELFEAQYLMAHVVNNRPGVRVHAGFARCVAAGCGRAFTPKRLGRGWQRRCDACLQITLERRDGATP